MANMECLGYKSLRPTRQQLPFLFSGDLPEVQKRCRFRTSKVHLLRPSEGLSANGGTVQDRISDGAPGDDIKLKRACVMSSSSRVTMDGKLLVIQTSPFFQSIQFRDPKCSHHRFAFAPSTTVVSVRNAGRPDLVSRDARTGEESLWRAAAGTSLNARGPRRWTPVPCYRFR